MRTLLRVVGGIWAIIGAANIFTSPVFDPSNKLYSQTGSGFVLIFNVMLFIIPGLLVAGIGSIIKKKAKEKKCPHCAEMISLEATLCKHCKSTVTA